MARARRMVDANVAPNAPEPTSCKKLRRSVVMRNLRDERRRARFIGYHARAAASVSGCRMSDADAATGWCRLGDGGTSLTRSPLGGDSVASSRTTHGERDDAQSAGEREEIAHGTVGAAAREHRQLHQQRL